LGLPKGHKGNVQPTGDPVEDSRRFSHPAKPGDGRQMVNQEKLDRLLAHFERPQKEISKDERHAIAEQRYTTKEKSAIMRDPRFRDEVWARLFDYFYGQREPFRDEVACFKMIMSVVGVQPPPKQKTRPTVNVNVNTSSKQTKVELSAADFESMPDEPIEVEAEKE